MTIWQKNFNSLVILTIVGILLGAYGVQILKNEQPCPLCMLQRLGMMGVAASLLLNIQFGIHMTHYALCLLSSLIGGGIALRQIALHICPGFPTFGEPVLGLSLYTWSFIIFACCILAIALLLVLYDPEESRLEKDAKNVFTNSAFIALFLIILANVVTTFLQCGWGPCKD